MIIHQSWSLVQAAQRGDMDAFATLYRRYSPVMQRFLMTRIADWSLAEDLTSETFLRALRGITNVENRGQEIPAWLITLARNAMLDQRKSAAHRREIILAHIDPGSRSVPGPQSHVHARLLHEEVMQCLGLLSADQRRCVVSRFIESTSVEDTAVMMGRNAGAIRARQHRAVRRLHELLRTRHATQPRWIGRGNRAVLTPGRLNPS